MRRNATLGTPALAAATLIFGLGCGTVVVVGDGTGGSGNAGAGAADGGAGGAGGGTGGAGNAGAGAGNGGEGGSGCVPDFETCNGADDDCDGAVDEDLGFQTCGLGACTNTVQLCVNGAPQACLPGTPTQEYCDAIDNDCDGQLDESDPSAGLPCDTGQPGVCNAGVLQCGGGFLFCAPTQVPGGELCDAQDNDCNGQVDDGNPGGGGACMTGLPGACAAGTLTCTAGALQCLPAQPPQAEICDGVDNDCDGQIDAGPCACGMTGTCVNGQFVCAGGPTIYFQEDFADNAAGWTFDPSWGIGPAQTSSGQTVGNPDPALDHTPTSDNGVAGVVIGGNAPTTVHPYWYLTSPVIDTNVTGSVFLEFWRWLNSDYTPFMQNNIQVYNGTTWVTVWQSGMMGIEDAVWMKGAFDITAHKNANLRIRIGYSSQSGVFTMSSWNLDDVVVSSALCP